MIKSSLGHLIAIQTNTHSTIDDLSKHLYHWIWAYNNDPHTNMTIFKRLVEAKKSKTFYRSLVSLMSKNYALNTDVTCIITEEN